MNSLFWNVCRLRLAGQILQAEPVAACHQCPIRGIELIFAVANAATWRSLYLPDLALDISKDECPACLFLRVDGSVEQPFLMFVISILCFRPHFFKANLIQNWQVECHLVPYQICSDCKCPRTATLSSHPSHDVIRVRLNRQLADWLLCHYHY